MIPLSVPYFQGKELEYITNAVRTEWVSTSGSYVDKFEKKVAEYVGMDKAVSCQSGTAGIHTALRILGVSKDQLVIVPTLTFIASVNPVRYLGADPVFMDCDDSLCIDPEKLEAFCENECQIEGNRLIHQLSQKEIRCVIVVHIFGNMADMDRIMAIANKYGLLVVEDATEALGTYYISGTYRGKYAGTIGDIGVYSFNGNKIITTGGGGMIVSSQKDIMKKARHLTTQAKEDELYYKHDEVGYNYRMTNIQAALGLAQMESLEHFIQTKRENYEYYREKLKENNRYELIPFSDHARCNCWFYSVFIKDAADETERNRIIEYMLSNGIQVRPVWGLIHEQKPYMGSYVFQIEKAHLLGKRIINLPCSTKLKQNEIDLVMDILEKYKG